MRVMTPLAMRRIVRATPQPPRSAWCVAPSACACRDDACHHRPSYAPASHQVTHRHRDSTCRRAWKTNRRHVYGRIMRVCDAHDDRTNSRVGVGEERLDPPLLVNFKSRRRAHQRRVEASRHDCCTRTPRAHTPRRASAIGLRCVPCCCCCCCCRFLCDFNGRSLAARSVARKFTQNPNTNDNTPTRSPFHTRVTYADAA
jgi:hypothetical protein